MEPVPRSKLGQYGDVSAWREISPGVYLPAEPYGRPAKPVVGPFLIRWSLLLVVIVAAVIIREFWPWAPYLGLTAGASYVIGRLSR